MDKHPTGIVCPGCGTEVHFQGGMAANLVLAAVRAQAAQRGVQICCDACGLIFLFQFPLSKLEDEEDELPNAPIPPPHLVASPILPPAAIDSNLDRAAPAPQESGNSVTQS